LKLNSVPFFNITIFIQSYKITHGTMKSAIMRLQLCLLSSFDIKVVTKLIVNRLSK